MISSMSKKLLLLSYLMSGVIMGAEKLGQHNCEVMMVKEAVWGTNQSVKTLIFFRKNEPGQDAFTGDYFDRPIKSVKRDTGKSGFLYIIFEDGNNIWIDVNKPLKTE